MPTHNRRSARGLLQLLTSSTYRRARIFQGVRLCLKPLLSAELCSAPAHVCRRRIGHERIPRSGLHLPWPVARMRKISVLRNLVVFFTSKHPGKEIPVKGAKGALVSLVCVVGLLAGMKAHAQSPSQENPVTPDQWLQWFQHDKFGLFIHFGPYSVLAGEWQGQRVPVGTEAEWIMQRFNIPVKDYREVARQLNPVKFHADEWVGLAKAAGMKYLVITAKHHDGFAMYHSQVSAYNIVDWTPFKRDLLKELAVACRKQGIRFCFYYSQREDWDDPDGYGNNWDYDRSKKNFDRYLELKSKPQLRELLTNYGPIGLVWFDRGLETREQAEDFVELVRGLQPRCLINGRVGSYGQDLMGDYQDMSDQRHAGGRNRRALGDAANPEQYLGI